MIRVTEAENIILSNIKDYGTDLLPFQSALGRILAEDIKADRDLPPCNRATMDGIAIQYNSFEKGIRTFHIKGIQAAGDRPIDIHSENECIEIMTGGSLSATVNTVIRYEDITIQDRIATVNTNNIRENQNNHLKGKDKKENDIVVTKGQVIDPAVISMAASVGKTKLFVKKLPKVIIISTGNELLDPADHPQPHQFRRSNSYTIQAVLQQYMLHADLLHLPDDPEVLKTKISECLSMYDVLIFSGGVSMGKFDHLPNVLKELSVAQHFHKVAQRPGKPFWFGTNTHSLVFAFPGNPVSAFMCLQRYFIPWLQVCLCLKQTPQYAVLGSDVTFAPPLQYFLQVKVDVTENGSLIATPTEGNGSGDFANLLDTNAFMELPLEKTNFMKGEVYPIWPYKKIVG